jgi:biotin carboxylase
MVLLSRAHAGPVGPHEHGGSAGLNVARFRRRLRRNELRRGNLADAGKSEMTEHQSKRLLLLTTTTGYQTRAFVEAAKRLELETVFGTDRCHVLDDPWQDGALPLRFEDPEGSARQIIEYARAKPVNAIVSIGDRPTLTAARASHALGLLHHPPEATEACRDKNLSRGRLRAAGLDVPASVRFPLAADPNEIVSSGSGDIFFPCVLKPLALSASRGVIRADTPRQFVTAFERIRALLLRPEIRVMRDSSSEFIQVERYVDGVEIAVEAAVDRGSLKIFALFDKPDPLTGPFFEETLYVAPSKLKPQAQTAVVETLERVVEALGLYHGPVHAEFRIELGSETGRAQPEHIWIMEIAARSIGGLCSRALRFCHPSTTQPLSLEEILIRLSLGESIDPIRRERSASGVMMIPIPQSGIYQGVDRLEGAREIEGIEEILITARPTQKLEMLPEGSSYLGFIFARGSSSAFVEGALRSAHRTLQFAIAPELPVFKANA